MNILFATSEAVPFAKTGGLADVCGALPVELARQGQSPVVIMPAYRHVFACGQSITPTGVDFTIPIGTKQVRGSLWHGKLPDSDVPVYFVRQDRYFDRPQLYTENGADYIDNCERFVFFCRAVLEAIHLLDLKTDLIHAHDWQTGLIPAYLKAEYRGIPGYESIGTLLTIHNMAFQGLFWHWDMLLTGLDWRYFNWQQMEFYGQLNLLKTGLVFADALNTVSPRYSEEIQSAPLGCGLEGVLQQRRGVLTGIINGVDYREWDPATDVHLTERYSLENVTAGKAVNKAALQRELGLPESAGVPLLGFVGRLTEQKGIDLVAQVMQEWLPTQNVQWVILGTGETKYHELFAHLAQRFPQRVSTILQFDNGLARRIEAAADMFLMPSRFEPCGLSQLYSLKYGTIPVVRATGGLADTITNLNNETLANRTANGFSFGEYSAMAFREALERALTAYAQPDLWAQLIANGMKQDWSWSRSAHDYIDLYESTLSRVRRTVMV